MIVKINSEALVSLHEKINSLIDFADFSMPNDLFFLQKSRIGNLNDRCYNSGSGASLAPSELIDEIEELSKPPNQTENKETPIISTSIHNSLPIFLQNCCEVFESDREKDVFLLSAITALSACFPSVYGVYDKKTVYSNIFLFVCAPAGSGKGAMAYSANLVYDWHDKLRKESEKAIQDYELEKIKYDIEIKETKGNPISDAPTEPPYLSLLFPANTSASGLLSQMKDTEGQGLIIESEADTLNNAVKQDWGGYSDMLRKAFHHERITSKRQSKKIPSEIPLPKLSVALSGTYSQAVTLIDSPENGLFSRFIYYSFKTDLQWRNVSPTQEGFSYDSFFQEKSKKISEIIEAWKNQDVCFQLTVNQWNNLNETFKEMQKQLYEEVSEQTTASVRRLGLICYRIAMIFSILRNEKPPANITCNDIDFNNALEMSKLLIEHTIHLFAKLPNKAYTQLRGNHLGFYEALPADFSRAQAIEKGKETGISQSNIDVRLLPKLKSLGLIKETKYGSYEKVVSKTKKLTPEI